MQVCLIKKSIIQFLTYLTFRKKSVISVHHAGKFWVKCKKLDYYKVSLE